MGSFISTVSHKNVPAAGLLLSVGFLALLVVVIASYSLGRIAERSFHDVIAARTLSGNADAMRFALQSAESSQRGYVLTGNQIYLAPYATAVTTARQRSNEIRSALSNQQDLGPALDRLSTLVDQKIEEMDQSISLKRVGNDRQARALVETNRGKALMDEANVFVSRIVRLADDQLRNAADRQSEALFLLRRINWVAAALILGVVAAVVWLFGKFAGGLAAAHDEVAALNGTLEVRVRDRTAELATARDRAELLMAEVNHRVANSLSLVASMVRMQSRAAPDARSRELLNNMQDRINAIGLVHKRLYESGDVRSVDLKEYLSTLLDQLDLSIGDDSQRAVLKQDLAPLVFPTDKTVSLGVITTELVTNAFKYAYPQGSGEIRIGLARTDNHWAELTVEDDGVGRASDASPRGTGLGTQLISAMVSSIGGTIEYHLKKQGTVARVLFPIESAS